jgi:hypothetical protein
MVNPAVTQANIHSTICKSGWATQQRNKYLPESASQALKAQMMTAYGLKDMSVYEGDHLIAIEDGGLPGGPGIEKNFWPQFNNHPNPHTLNTKDLVENAANAAICGGRLSLSVAQAGLAGNWIALGRQLGTLPK